MADKAQSTFEREVRQKQMPFDVAKVPLPEGVRDGNGRLRIDKLLPKVGLADSVSDAVRKIKAGAVRINGMKAGLVIPEGQGQLTIQVGHEWRHVLL